MIQTASMMLKAMVMSTCMQCLECIVLNARRCILLHCNVLCFTTTHHHTTPWAAGLLSHAAGACWPAS